MHEIMKAAKDIAKTEESLKDICEQKKKLVDLLVSCKYKLDSEEGGQIVDMIKDLAEAEEKCWKSAYYKVLIETMAESSEYRERRDYDDDNRPMGYDNWRYESGRFAPKGRGHMSGYMPYLDNMMDYPMMMGYDGGRTNGRRNDMSGYNDRNMDTGRSSNSRYGYTYDDYNEAKRHYTETRSEHDKNEMDMKGKEAVDNVVHVATDIWDNADPMFRKEMKAELSKMIGKMNV